MNLMFLRRLATRALSRFRGDSGGEDSNATPVSVEGSTEPVGSTTPRSKTSSKRKAPGQGRRIPKPRQNDCHTILWTNAYCKKLQRAGDAGRRLSVIFGGSHQSQPSLSRFGVEPGDQVAVLRVESGQLFLVATLWVRELTTFERYAREELGLPKADLDLQSWTLEAKLAAAHPDWGHRLPWGCITEVAVGDGSPIDFNRVVPRAVVEELRFVSRRGERPLRHVVEGRIKSTISLQGGAYRLRAKSAEDLLSLVREA